MPSQAIIDKLNAQQNIWIASVREDGRPHLVPVWFVWFQEKIYFGTESRSVKARNLRANPRVAAALEEGAHPVICEGTAKQFPKPWPDALLAAFMAKYEWDLTQEHQYHDVWEITPVKWLRW
jgi:nitroimidazol reductase NimA-like FMN-containing flavoprotein (pyridoxamine 5'-phosphate oxidase superfamily)